MNLTTNKNEIVTGIIHSHCKNCNDSLESYETTWCEDCLYDLPESDIKQAFIYKMERKKVK